jgi:hypothetical protein
MNLYNIIESIKNINISGPTCIYIAVGSAAYRIEMRDNKPFLDNLYYHQYPAFLEDMQDVTIIHILIDTNLESPPFMTIDTHKGLEFVKLNGYYRSTNNKHIVYELKESVTMCAYNLEYTDITRELHELNNIAIQKNILLVYNDFTGKSHKPIAEYFDPMISNHLDHIVYGLASRADLGCYIDILSPTCRFAYTIESNIIKVFNIYDLINKNKCLEDEVNKYSDESIEIIESSIKIVIHDTYEYFSNNILPVLRNVYQLSINKLTVDDLGYFMNNLFPEHIFRTKHVSTFIDKLYNLIRLKLYTECFNQLIEAFSYHLDKLIYVKQLDIDRLDLMKIITSDENEYNWINTLKNV